MMTVPTMAVACIAWTVLGLVSISRLGRVLETTGRNLQGYRW
jgi:hypothetical protein